MDSLKYTLINSYPLWPDKTVNNKLLLWFKIFFFLKLKREMYDLAFSPIKDSRRPPKNPDS